MRIFFSFTYYLILCLFWGCSENPHEVDLTGHEQQLEIKRFEQDLLKEKLQSSELEKKYGYFFKAFRNKMIANGQQNDSLLSQNLKAFKNDQYVGEVFRAVDEQFHSLDNESQVLSKAFSYYHYHFPNKVIPNVVSFVSGFNYGAVALDSTLAIGLDMFLGKNNDYYNMLQFPVYQQTKMTRPNLPYQAIKSWLVSEFEEKSKSNMLDKLIYTGKQLYLMDALFVEASDSMKIGYTNQQIHWANQNELAVWSHIVDNKLLYSKIYSDYFKFFNNGPFTTSLSRESPPRMGEYIGWQIVRSFMSNNQVTVDSLMKIDDSQWLLSNSKYKPKR